MTSSQKFSVVWSNNETRTRSMSQHVLTLRKGITCSNLHLDQVTVLFRPSSDIQPAEYLPGDDGTFSWRVETAQLMVRIRPGVEHVFYAVNGDTTNTDMFIKQPNESLIYSCSMCIAPNVEGVEDYWQRTYRPVRDIPVSRNLNDISEIDIQLLFPLLFTTTSTSGIKYSSVPDYRILKVYCEFSLDS